MKKNCLQCVRHWAGLFVWCVLALSSTVQAKLGIEYQTPLGNPDGAVADPASRRKYLIQRDQFALSYNDAKRQANWVSWSYSLCDDGPVKRTDAWAVEEMLPPKFSKIGTASFGPGWDRGHMCPSADRRSSRDDNRRTFRMSNVIPQASQNNRRVWSNFENYSRSLAANGDEVLVITGPAQFTGERLANQMAIPSSLWKIVVQIPDAASPTPANERITEDARVIAILTPNVNTGLGPWQNYITSIEEIEKVTGLDFLTDIDPSVATYLKNVVDTGRGPNTPTVVTTFEPVLGAPGTTVNISGYNFGDSPEVWFNGAAAPVTAVGSNNLTVTVPEDATSGPITITGPDGTDTSHEDFTVSDTGDTPHPGMAAATRTRGADKLLAVTGGTRNVRHHVPWSRLRTDPPAL